MNSIEHVRDDPDTSSQVEVIREHQETQPQLELVADADSQKQASESTVLSDEDQAWHQKQGLPCVPVGQTFELDEEGGKRLYMRTGRRGADCQQCLHHFGVHSYSRKSFQSHSVACARKQARLEASKSAAQKLKNSEHWAGELLYSHVFDDGNDGGLNVTVRFQRISPIGEYVRPVECECRAVLKLSDARHLTQHVVAKHKPKVVSDQEATNKRKAMPDRTMGAQKKLVTSFFQAAPKEEDAEKSEVPKATGATVCDAKLLSTVPPSSSSSSSSTFEGLSTPLERNEQPRAQSACSSQVPENFPHAQSDIMGLVQANLSSAQAENYELRCEVARLRGENAETVARDGECVMCRGVPINLPTPVGANYPHGLQDEPFVTWSAPDAHSHVRSINCTAFVTAARNTLAPQSSSSSSCTECTNLLMNQKLTALVARACNPDLHLTKTTDKFLTHAQLVKRLRHQTQASRDTSFKCLALQKRLNQVSPPPEAKVTTDTATNAACSFV